MATKTVQGAAAATQAINQAQSLVKAPMFNKRLGNKQIFLPNFVLTMIRNPKLPPTFASFIVPLNLNKLDLRDYLWNAYGIPVVGVRSYIQQQKIRQDKPGVERIAPRRWFRPRSIKKMTVEMARPFVWPPEPTGEALEKWDHTTYKQARKENEERGEEYQRDFKLKPPKDRAKMKEQAEKLLAGEEKWRPSNREVWEDVGEEREVETEIDLSRPEDDADSPKLAR